MSISKRSKIGYTAIVLIALVFIAAVMASNNLLRGVRLDLTQNHLYTLSPGSKAVLADIGEPIDLYFFFSNKESADLPALRTYAQRVHEMLDELAANAGGKLKVKVIDPEPFSPQEDRATQFGLQSVDLGTRGQNIFLGVAGTNSVGSNAKIAFLNPNKAAFLEYDLMRMIYSLAHPKKPVVGLISGVPMAGGFNARTQQASQSWVITQQVRQFFDLRTLPQSIDKIDKDIDVLWLVHPKSLDDKTLYAIDQYILGGGRALIFVDPLAEIAGANGGAGLQAAGSSSNLGRLFKAWGIDYSPTQVVTDNVNALSLDRGYGRLPVKHIGLIGIPKTSMDQKDVITAGLDTVNFGDAGYFAKAKGAKVTMTPLISSSTQTDLMPASKLQFVGDPEKLLDDFVASGKTYALAARLSGHLDTAFPGGPPEAAKSTAAKSAATPTAATVAGKPAPGADSAPAKSSKPDAAHAASTPRKEIMSTDHANVVLVADVDVLSDRMWVQKQNFLGRNVETAFASNGDFVVNALDNLSGSAELIGLKSRATYSRPFTTVQALRRNADARFRDKQQQLQAELMQTEKKLGALQSTRADKTSLLMTTAQEQQVQHFRNQQAQIRKQLRAVQHNLNEDIEALGTRLKVIDILIMPVVLTLLVFLGFYYARRRHGA